MNDKPVLVVEDDAMVSILVDDILAGAGYRPVCAPDGAAVLPCPTHTAPLLAAVVDLRLTDGLDGRTIILRLRERQPAIPVVVVTGYDSRAPQADLRGLGGPTVRLGKPLACDAFLGHMADMLDGRAVQVAAQRRRKSDVPAPVTG